MIVSMLDREAEGGRGAGEAAEDPEGDGGAEEEEGGGGSRGLKTGGGAQT